MTTETQECVHYWRIALAEGPESLGKCQNCRATRFFKNFIDNDVPAAWPQRRKGFEDAE